MTVLVNTLTTASSNLGKVLLFKKKLLIFNSTSVEKDFIDKKGPNSVWKLELGKLRSRCGQERLCNQQNRAEGRPPQLYAHK